MPTKKRGKGKGPARRGRGARAAASRRAKPAAKKSRTRAARRAKPRAAKPAAGRELAALKARFVREKSALEKRLTDTVREIGQLRHHEARAAQLERQLKERDDTIAQLRSQLSGMRQRDLAAADDDVQPSLALGSRRRDDLDDFEEELDVEEDDELI